MSEIKFSGILLWWNWFSVFLKTFNENFLTFRASHGTVSLSDDEIKAVYGEKKLFQHYERFIDTADNIKNEQAGLLCEFLEKRSLYAS